MPSTCAAAATRAPDFVPLCGAPFAVFSVRAAGGPGQKVARREPCACPGGAFGRGKMTRPRVRCEERAGAPGACCTDWLAARLQPRPLNPLACPLHNQSKQSWALTCPSDWPPTLDGWFVPPPGAWTPRRIELGPLALGLPPPPMLPLEGLLRLTCRARADGLQTCHQRHQRKRLTTVKGGTEPQARIIENGTTNGIGVPPPECPTSPHAGSLTKCPASPFATAAEQDEVLALADAICELAHHHLEFGREGPGEDYIHRTAACDLIQIMPLSHRSHRMGPTRGQKDLEGVHSV